MRWVHLTWEPAEQTLRALGGVGCVSPAPARRHTRPAPHRTPLPAGHREADERNRYSLPAHLSLKNLELITKAAASTEGVATDGSKFGRHFSDLFDQQLTWEFLPWLKKNTRLPVLLKVRQPRPPLRARRAAPAGLHRPARPAALPF